MGRESSPDHSLIDFIWDCWTFFYKVEEELEETPRACPDWSLIRFLLKLEENYERKTRQFPYWFLTFLTKNWRRWGSSPENILIDFLSDSCWKVKERREELTRPFPYCFLISFILKIEEEDARPCPFWFLVRFLSKIYGEGGGTPQTMSYWFLLNACANLSRIFVDFSSHVLNVK